MLRIYALNPILLPQCYKKEEAYAIPVFGDIYVYINLPHQFVLEILTNHMCDMCQLGLTRGVYAH